MKRSPQTSALKWLCTPIIYLLFISTMTHAKVYYGSCEEALKTEGSRDDKNYPIELANGVVVSLFCQGMKTGSPKEFLNLPSGRSTNYASVYSNIGVQNTCEEWDPPQKYNLSGKTEFEKVRFDTGSSAIVQDDFTFAKQIGLNNIKYGTAGDKFSPNKKCTPRGNFRIDLSLTPFIVSKKTQWVWKGKFFDGSQDGKPLIEDVLYIGCYIDKSKRAMPSAFLTSRSMTITKCINHCKYRKFTFAGLQDSNECWCGNKYNGYGVSKKCTSKCSGDKGKICGGPWALSVYFVGSFQIVDGRCGGYPGSCYPAQIKDKDNELLLLEINPNHPCRHSICGLFTKCLAIDAASYKCLCPKGFSGERCDKRDEIIPKDGICPPKYQAEICRCDAKDCFGARFVDGKCHTLGGKPQVVCRYGDSSHVKITTATSTSRYPSVSCPYETTLISCTYWDPKKKVKSDGVTGTRKSYRRCSYYKCKGCQVQATCFKYSCGCKNGGKCDMESEQCLCRPGYSGRLCEDYDYCSAWETSHKKAACSGSGICRSVPKLVVSTIGGDMAGNRCIFPFKYQGQTFSRCISDNKVGPPFACAGEFNGRSSNIELGKWSPGPAYSILIWVKPTFTDSINRLIIGSIWGCGDFGIGFQYGSFQTYYASTGKGKDGCTVPLATHNHQFDLNKWHSVAVMHTGRTITLRVNGRSYGSRTTYSNFLGNAHGLQIGGGSYYGTNKNAFKGMIKNVKIYNKALRSYEVDKIFQENGVDDTDEIKRGLVGHFELGEKIAKKCNGIDHSGQDWIPESRSQISGIHCNISKFIIQKDTTVFVTRWNGTSGGALEVTANEILIEGELTAAGAGYLGGRAANTNGADGTQGESHSDPGRTDVNSNRGGGGGGLGQNNFAQGGLPGGGGGYNGRGQPGSSSLTKDGNGQGGQTYGKTSMDHIYLGSGGGSGGNAIDLTQTPMGGRGGNGGGAIKLYAATQVTIKGSVGVQGEDGIGDTIADKCLGCPAACKPQGKSCTSTSSTSCWDTSGPGGGGSGGSLYISGESVDIGTNRLFAMGGTGGQGANMCGGVGGMGRIYVEYSSLSGSQSIKQGRMVRARRSDKITDFSHIGHTVGNDQIPTNINPVYLGCHKETKDFLMKHKLTLSPVDARRLTPLNCHKLCTKAGHIYSGTTEGDKCYCDDFVTTVFATSDSDCDSPCPGDKMQVCGGIGKVLIFGPKPKAFAKLISGRMAKCESWCVTDGIDDPQPKWGQCQDEGSTLSMSITCECPSGTTGDDCTQECPETTWGIDCRHNCSCNGHPCDPTNGNCSCGLSFHGHSCERRKCPSGRGGRNCEVCYRYNRYGKDCKKCDCGHSRCDQVTGRCRCQVGSMGDHCEKGCPPGRFGHSCYRHCNCHNNATCEPIYGMCHCPPGYAGRKCDEQCPAGIYGDRCASSCPICNTDTCHHVTGNCLCNSGYKGSNCTELCSLGKWGVGCARSCDSNCESGCNPMEGFCCSKDRCAEGQYCDEDGNCIRADGVLVTSASLGAGPIVGIVLFLLLIILCAVVGITYFFMGKAMFSPLVAKYKTQRDGVVLEGNFANPFYDQMNDASKPDDTPEAKGTTETE